MHTIEVVGVAGRIKIEYRDLEDYKARGYEPIEGTEQGAEEVAPSPPASPSVVSED